MALLKKIWSATLMEALVATIIIVVIFVVASLVMNNLLLNTFKKNTHQTDSRLNELEYKIQNKQLGLPYSESLYDWDINIQKSIQDSKTVLLISAQNRKNGQVINRKSTYEE